MKFIYTLYEFLCAVLFDLFCMQAKFRQTIRKDLGLVSGQDSATLGWRIFALPTDLFINVLLILDMCLDFLLNFVVPFSMCIFVIFALSSHVVKAMQDLALANFIYQLSFLCLEIACMLCSHVLLPAVFLGLSAILFLLCLNTVAVTLGIKQYQKMTPLNNAVCPTNALFSKIYRFSQSVYEAIYEAMIDLKNAMIDLKNAILGRSTANDTVYTEEEGGRLPSREHPSNVQGSIRTNQAFSPTIEDSPTGSRDFASGVSGGGSSTEPEIIAVPVSAGSSFLPTANAWYISST